MRPEARVLALISVMPSCSWRGGGERVIYNVKSIFHRLTTPGTLSSEPAPIPVAGTDLLLILTTLTSSKQVSVL
jgi:hypothetical protein